MVRRWMAEKRRTVSGEMAPSSSKQSQSNRADAVVLRALQTEPLRAIAGRRAAANGLDCIGIWSDGHTGLIRWSGAVAQTGSWSASCPVAAGA